MTYIKTFALALIAAFSLAASPLMADVILENWQFDDANGTQLNSVCQLLFSKIVFGVTGLRR